ncbi:NADP-dependent phosphogluconate dehydrogenase [soil metagenome]
MSAKFDLGMVGLGTMGRALLLNMADKGNAVAGYDIDPEKAHSLVSEGGAPVDGFTDIEAFVKSIHCPRAIMILVPAGAPVDSVLNSLSPHLEKGDFVIDGGNSYFKDTDRRLKEMEAKGFGFMGMGVSGGEKGARLGPSMMPGGTPAQYERVRKVLESIAAHHKGTPCVALMGAGSAGHYVKMVHNGIEYAMMQIISEVYEVLKGYHESDEECAALFEKWAEGSFGGYLLEITAEVLRYPDDRGDGLLLDHIADRAKAKGTGKWASQDAMDLGVPVPAIDAAVIARTVSAYQADRLKLDKGLGQWHYGRSLEIDDETFGKAIECAMLLAYIQGIHQIHLASEEYGYGTNLDDVLKVWRAGCIIRSKLLDPLRAALPGAEGTGLLLHDKGLMAQLSEVHLQLRWVITACIQYGHPAPALSASLAYLEGMTTGRLRGAALIQGQRDLFGAHGYERLDCEGNFHADWDHPRRPDADAQDEKEPSKRVTPKVEL